MRGAAHSRGPFSAFKSASNIHCAFIANSVVKEPPSHRPERAAGGREKNQSKSTLPYVRQESNSETKKNSRRVRNTQPRGDYRGFALGELLMPSPPPGSQIAALSPDHDLFQFQKSFFHLTIIPFSLRSHGSLTCGSTRQLHEYRQDPEPYLVKFNIFFPPEDNLFPQ